MLSRQSTSADRTHCALGHRRRPLARRAPANSAPDGCAIGRWVRAARAVHGRPGPQAAFGRRAAPAVVASTPLSQLNRALPANARLLRAVSGQLGSGKGLSLSPPIGGEELRAHRRHPCLLAFDLSEAWRPRCPQHHPTAAPALLMHRPSEGADHLKALRIGNTLLSRSAVRRSPPALPPHHL